MSYVTIKQFCEQHNISLETFYFRARKRGVDLKALKVNSSPIYREADLLVLVPPLWQDKRKRKKSEMKE